MIKKLLSICFLSAVSVVLCAQPKPFLSSHRVDLGDLLWHNAKRVSFQIKNVGNSDLQIKTIEADCGCVQVDWPKQNIAPGKSATVKVSYDAEMLGTFNRSLEIFTNASEEPLFFTLTGRVNMESPGRASDYQFRLGDVCLSADNIEFDDVRKGDAPVKEIEIFNDSKETITPNLMHLPPFLQASISPRRLHPQRKGKIKLRLLTDKLDNMGLTQRSVYFSTFKGQRVTPNNEMIVSVTLLPDAAPAGKVLYHAPEAVLDSTFVDLSHLTDKKVIKTSLNLMNKGTAALEIQLLQVYNPGISVSISKRKILPGQQAKIKISLLNQPGFFKGRRRILIITNDPKQPKSVIDLKLK